MSDQVNTVTDKNWNIRCLLKALSFSLIVSTISLLVVFLAPFNISEPEVSPESPYTGEIKRLRDKGFLLSDKSQRLHKLVEQQNEYLLSEAQSRSGAEQTTWSRKSTILSPLIALIWLLSYWAFVNRSKVVAGAVIFPVLSIPFLLSIIGVMSVIEVCLIIMAVLAVVVWRHVIAVRSNN